MNTRSLASWVAAAALIPSLSHAQTAIFSDDFDDNTITGWTFLDRNGEEEIANANWVEQNGNLEQLTANYDFRRGKNNRPTLGTLALAPTQVGGHYEISATFTSLEPGNIFQDQDFVFGYDDEDNFFLLEALAENNRLSLYQVIDGERIIVREIPNAITFSDESTLVTLRHNATTGLVTVNYGDDEPVEFIDPALIITGTHSVGVGSNNDAFTIDDFTITSGFPIDSAFVLEITSFVRDPQTGTISLTWASELDVEYFIDRATDLTDWQEIDDATGQAGSTNFSDPSPELERAFYRIRTEG